MALAQFQLDRVEILNTVMVRYSVSHSGHVRLEALASV